MHTTASCSRRSFIGGALAAGAALSCSASLAWAESAPKGEKKEDGSYEIVDQAGRTVVFDKVPVRVATTIIPFPSMYYAFMGDTDTLIACNPYAFNFYERSMLSRLWPSMADCKTGAVGTDFSVNIEEMLSLKPDVVFQWTSEAESIKAMENAGLKVIGLQYGGVEDLKTWIELLGQIFDQQERADFLLDYFDQQIAETASITEQINQEDRPSGIHLVDEAPTVFCEGFTPYWMDKSGVNDPAAEVPGTEVQVDMEQIMVWNPDYIFIGNFSGVTASDILANNISGQDWSHIKAVENGNVYNIPVGCFIWDPPCLETPLMVKWVAKTVYPDLFADMDIEQEIVDFYQEVYGYEINGDDLDHILNNREN